MHFVENIIFQAKKLRLISFWMEVEKEDMMKPHNLWMKKSWSRPDNEETIQSDLDTFLSEVKRSGVLPEGTVLRNCEVSHTTDNKQATLQIHLYPLI